MEEEEDLRLKAEEESRLADGEMMRVEENERARLRVVEGVPFSLESRQRA